MLKAKTIANIPLFIGLTQNELDDIVRTVHFDSHHHKKGNDIIKEYSACNDLTIVTRGRVAINIYSDNRSYHIIEYERDPLIIEPDKLFGMATHYRSTYTALTPCDTLTIHKDKLLHLMKSHIIVRLNYLNIICHKTQLLENQLWHNNPTDLKACVTTFIRQHTKRPTGKKTVYIKMVQLARETNLSRLEVSKALNMLQDEEKIILKRGIIEIPELQLL